MPLGCSTPNPEVPVVPRTRSEEEFQELQKQLDDAKAELAKTKSMLAEAPSKTQTGSLGQFDIKAVRY
jgi:hypothetical protein